MFEEFYASFWQHPALLWVAPVVFLFFIPRDANSPRAKFFAQYLLIFTVLTILDPLVTGPFLGWAKFPDAVSSKIAIAFVILGDLRFFAVIEHFSAPSTESGSLRRWVRALAWSLIVPVLQLGLIALLPGMFAEVRHTYLVYEILFLVLALALRFVVLPRRELPEPVRHWLNSACEFAMIYYGLWASADVVILAGFDWGFALRMIPNQLYYSLFLPFVWWKAPTFLKQRNAVAA